MVLHLCNPMSCSGFSTQIFGSCSIVWIAAAALFFLIMFGRKWVAEPIGMPWSNVGAFAIGYLGLLVAAVISCNPKIALGVGIVGAIVGAYFGGAFFGDGSGGGY